jgi:hypothetical protein
MYGALFVAFPLVGDCSNDVRGCSSMVEPQPSKLAMPVRSRSPAPPSWSRITMHTSVETRVASAELVDVLSADTGKLLVWLLLDLGGLLGSEW